MELSETYDTKIEVRNHHYHSLRRMEPPAQLRNNVPKVEKDQLIRKIQALASKNSALVEKQDYLQNTIYDLRKLLEFVGKQSLEECTFLHNKNKVLQQKIKGLEKGLQISHSNSNHIQRCSLYWSEFLS